MCKNINVDCLWLKKLHQLIFPSSELDPGARYSKGQELQFTLTMSCKQQGIIHAAASLSLSQTAGPPPDPTRESFDTPFRAAQFHWSQIGITFLDIIFM